MRLRLSKLRTVLYFFSFVFLVSFIAHSAKLIPLDWIYSNNVKRRNEPRQTTDKSRIKTKNTIVDMVNDYVPYVDFKLVYPEIMPTIESIGDLFLVILVNSGAKGDEFRYRRDNIRKTWGSHTNCEQLKTTRDQKLKNLKWMLVFVLGKSGPGTNDDERNAQEAKEHNDILIGNINDNYLNNIIKFYMGQLWASTLQSKYVLKTDDDVYVRIPGVLEYLVNKANFSRPFYGGVPYIKDVVHRSPGGKWSISKKYYAEDVFPPFNAGAFFILSTDLHNRLFNYVHHRKPFHTDDAYIGVAMNDLKVGATHIVSFIIKHDMPVRLPHYTDCKTQATVAFGHSLDHNTSKVLHDQLETMCRKNFTTTSC